MFDYQLTIGLYDRETATQKISSAAAKTMISDLLLNRFGIYAFTMIDCSGCYKMDDGRIVQEPSIRIEIASDDDIISTVRDFIATAKDAEHLNQESIMMKVTKSAITFE